MSKYCSQCGASTITTCDNCGERIRGYYHITGVISLQEYESPSFCHSCGKPFPWTLSKLEAAKELANEMDELSLEERERLKMSIDDLVASNPKTEVAAVRYKKIMSRVGREAAASMRSILTDILSEAAKKALFG
jgi:hypothetical protein